MTGFTFEVAPMKLLIAVKQNVRSMKVALYFLITMHKVNQI